MFRTIIRTFLAPAVALVIGALATSSAFAQGATPQQFMNKQSGTTYTFVARDCSKFITFSNAAAVAVTLPQAGTGGFLQGCFFDVKNIGAGTATITPTTSKIIGASNAGSTSLALPTLSSAHITNDGTDYYWK